MLALNARRRGINRASTGLLDIVQRASIARYGAGVGEHHDVSRAQVERNALDLALIDLDGERSAIVAMMNALRNRSSDEAIADPAPSKGDVPALPPRRDLEALAIAQRPELKRMRAMRREENAMASLARRERYPDIMTSVWYNQVLGAPDSAGMMLGATLPVFGVRRQNRLAGAADLRSQSVDRDVEAMRAMIRFEIADASRKVSTAGKTLAFLRDVAQKRAEDSFQSAIAGYSAGTLAIVGVLDAWRSLLAVELARAEATVMQSMAWAELERARTGRCSMKREIRCLAAGSVLLLTWACKAPPHAGEHANASAEPPPTAAAAGEAHAGHDAGQDAGAGPPAGYAAFTLSADKARAVGLQTAHVEQRDFKRAVRTVGALVLDETRTSHVHSKVRGWIESVSADFVGKRVRRGAPLCSIYSQEVYAAELEFLSVLEQSTPRAPLTGAFADAERRAQSQLLGAARRRLQLWDVPKAELERLERSREARRTFTLAAPRAGVILAKQSLAGMFIEPSVELYVISDVDKLWVLADIYDTDVPFVRLGEAAKLTIGGSSEERKATVAFIPPTIEERTRTLKVRFEVDNKDGRLRPGAFATVEMNLPMGRSLAVPENAVIHAGTRKLAFVVTGDRVEPREIVLGPVVGGFYRVERGLSEHDQVAVNAQFLIDSESRLRATSSPGGGHAGH